MVSPALKVNQLIRDPDNLFLFTFQMHFDTIEVPVIKCAMLEPVYLEISTQFAVEAHQQILIECRRHFLLIIISGLQNADILDQVDPYQ